MSGAVSVIVPTYRRPEMLRDCLTGLSGQTRPADQVVVVRRRDDDATAEVIRTAPLLVEEVLIDAAGQLAALKAGVARAHGALLVFTDDDVVPRPGWLAALIRHYDDPLVGGVGGRDVPHPDPGHTPVASHAVGRFGRWGKHYGFQHAGAGPPADVQVLRGANMSFRRSAHALPCDLLGEGAQVHNDMATSLWAVSQGWRLRYDPAVLVDHYSGERFDEDQRHRPSAGAVRNEAYNLVLTLLTLRPELTQRRAVYGLLIGDTAVPGLVRALVALLLGSPSDVPSRLLPSLTGQCRALRDLRRGTRLLMEPSLVPS